MNRRAFLTLVGGVSLGAAVTFTPVGRLLGLPVELQLGDQRFRGTPDGKILVAGSQGDEWALHTNFGPDFSILDLKAHSSGSLHAKLEYKGHSFTLALEPHGTIWRTV